MLLRRRRGGPLSAEKSADPFATELFELAAIDNFDEEGPEDAFELAAIDAFEPATTETLELEAIETFELDTLDSDACEPLVSGRPWFLDTLFDREIGGFDGSVKLSSMISFPGFDKGLVFFSVDVSMLPPLPVGENIGERQKF